MQNDFGIVVNVVNLRVSEIDNVCSLLNSPRTAQEAQDYYKISSQSDTSSVDNVSEQEVQNILIHYNDYYLSYVSLLF